MIRGDSELTSAHQKELCAKAPPVPLFNPARPLQDPANPGRPAACNLCLSMATHSVIFPAYHTSCSLLTATPACLVSSLKRQERQIEWGKFETQRTRAEPTVSRRVAWMWWQTWPKCGKNEAEPAISAWNICTEWVKGASRNHPFKLNWLPKYFSDELGFICCSVWWSHPQLCSDPAVLQLWQFAWPEGKEDWLGCFKVTLSYWDVVCWFFLLNCGMTPSDAQWFKKQKEENASMKPQSTL